MRSAQPQALKRLWPRARVDHRVEESCTHDFEHHWVRPAQLAVLTHCMGPLEGPEGCEEAITLTQQPALPAALQYKEQEAHQQAQHLPPGHKTST